MQGGSRRGIAAVEGMQYRGEIYREETVWWKPLTDVDGGGEIVKPKAPKHSGLFLADGVCLSESPVLRFKVLLEDLHTLNISTLLPVV